VFGPGGLPGPRASVAPHLTEICRASVDGSQAERAPERAWSDGYARRPPAFHRWLYGQAARPVYTGWVTAKEQLQRLVAEMGEEQASRALGLIKPLLQDKPDNGQTPRLPEFVGSGDSGRSDLSERVDELLAEGFGR